MLPARRSSRLFVRWLLATSLVLTCPVPLSAQVNHWWAGVRGHGISPDRVFRTDDVTALTVPLAETDFDFPQDGLWAHLLPAQATVGARRIQHEGFYDAARRRVIFVGGSEVTYKSDVQVLYIDVPYRWLTVSTSGSPPSTPRISGQPRSTSGARAVS